MKTKPGRDPAYAPAGSKSASAAAAGSSSLGRFAAPPADVSADREPTARELLAAARSVQRERDSILADAEAKRNAAEAFRAQLARELASLGNTLRPRTVTPRPSAQGAKVDPLRDYPHHLV